MLIDETADPHEMKNLANDPQYASVCAELGAMVKKYSANLGKIQTP
jgi:hypothetical protein